MQHIDIDALEAMPTVVLSKPTPSKRPPNMLPIILEVLPNDILNATIQLFLHYQILFLNSL